MSLPYKDLGIADYRLSVDDFLKIFVVIFVLMIVPIFGSYLMGNSFSQLAPTCEVRNCSK